MKVIVAGSRWIWDRELVYRAITSSGFHITELVSGCNRGWDMGRKCQIGVDGFGEDWAKERGIPVKPFHYRRDLGYAGGPVRNGHMAQYVAPDGGLILVWDGISRGSASMLREAMNRRLQIFERIVSKQEGA